MSVVQNCTGRSQTVEDRAKQLEADVRYHQDRADRAENGYFGLQGSGRILSIRKSP